VAWSINRNQTHPIYGIRSLPPHIHRLEENAVPEMEDHKIWDTMSEICSI